MNDSDKKTKKEGRYNKTEGGEQSCMNDMQ